MKPRASARRRHDAHRRRDRQGGWAGLLVLLVALVIVAWLAKDALVKYGMVPSAETVTRRAAPETAMPAPATGDVAATTGAPARTPMDAARSLETVVKQQEDKRSGGY